MEKLIIAAVLTISETDVGKQSGKKFNATHTVPRHPFTKSEVTYSRVKAPPQKLFEADRASFTRRFYVDQIPVRIDIREL